MKRFKYSIILLLVVLTTKLHGDIIMVKPTPSKICVRINYLKDFPDIAVIGLSDWLAFSRSNKAYCIESGFCMKVYKPRPLSLYAMSMDYFKQCDLDQVDWKNDKNVQKLNLTVKAKSINTDDYRSLEVDFNLASYNDTTLYLYQTKLTYKHKDERPDSIQYFKNNIVDPFKPISVSTEDARKE